jgi:hypothetical protein
MSGEKLKILRYAQNLLILIAISPVNGDYFIRFDENYYIFTGIIFVVK